ncbi:uncharacterized protein LOC110628554 isoform X2 [Manihot esculenta]|uniref:Bromodomain associated domain-containing protein n=1 Tax=Manihot esculenta TaxID=3983 RepID=A0A2C9UVM0_MANES|nr:uncharacterized protein LOC110628554 isoform X2 [Manihot esculenta]OAY35727.1 hypothetical protein MANES_12G125300v8 [Manihot esculenta]
MSLLGDDGRGFELARKLETQGVWRSWLGDSLYSNFVHFLSSPSAWDSFMRADEPKSKPQIHLQLRVRALLFDKASVSLFLSSNSPATSSSSIAVSKLNPNYLQLHGDDVYFTLEDGDQRREAGGGVGPNAAPSKSHSKSSFSTGSRYGDSEMESIPQRFRNEEFPETWYNQFMEKHKVSRPYRSSFGDRDLDKRSPEEMSNYLGLLDKHKRRCLAFTPSMHTSSVLDGNSADADVSFFPETMFMSNCIPDSALPLIIRTKSNEKIEFRGVLDSLPQTRSSVVIERLGISVEQGGSLHRPKNGSEGNKKLLGQEQASQMCQKVVAHMLAQKGFEGATEVPLEVLSQLLRCHISKLGHILKVFADSYRKQCSAIDLIKMFLQTAGYSNLGNLVELKDGSKNIVQQTQQQIHGIQAQLQPQHQSALRLPQQISRPMHPQMQQMVLPQNLAFQQMERMRRRQQSTPRPAMDMDKERPMVQVKIENPPDLPMDGNAFNSIQSRHPQLQFRQQQLAAMSNLQAQSSNQFRQLASMQVPQMQTPNMGIVRAPPVKVEGFQELMGGDASVKHDTEENKLTSPSSK